MHGHGVVRDEDGAALEFRFGLLKVVESVAATWFFNPMSGEPAAVEWPFRAIDFSFDRALARVRLSFFGLARSALHMDRCLSVLLDPDAQMRDGMHLDEAAPWLNAHEDVHLYADLILHYLYDYADGLALAMSRFFPDVSPRPAEGSFFKHRKSVLNGAAQDDAYAAIFREKTAWFDQLAATLDDPVPGLRTMLVHGHGSPSDFRNQPGERAVSIRNLLSGFCGMHDDLLEWVENRISGVAVPGTQLRVILDADPPFMTYSEPTVEASLFCSFPFPDAVT